MTLNHLAVTRDGAVALVEIDRPEKRNALTAAMWQAVADTFRELDRSGDVRAVVLAGRGGVFSAGADIGEFGAVRSDAGSARSYERLNSDAFRAIRTMRVPVIAAIAGPCFGGGFGLAAACDLRIGEESARFAVPAARLGLAYPEDAVADIVQALGSQRARHLLFTAAALDARQAMEAGFLLEIAPDAPARAMEIARTIADNAPLSVRAGKAAIAAALVQHADLSAEARLLGDATFDSADYAEGRAAFAERRRPGFTGR